MVDHTGSTQPSFHQCPCLGKSVWLWPTWNVCLVPFYALACPGLWCLVEGWCGRYRPAPVLPLPPTTCGQLNSKSLCSTPRRHRFQISQQPAVRGRRLSRSWPSYKKVFTSHVSAVTRWTKPESPETPMATTESELEQLPFCDFVTSCVCTNRTSLQSRSDQTAENPRGRAGFVRFSAGQRCEW